MRANPNDTLPQFTADYVRPGSLLTITIGRNVGNEPMSDARWTFFVGLTQTLVQEFFAPTLEFGPFFGTGEWDGITEESAVLTAVTHYPGSVPQFSERVAALAKEFGQDAIAWSFGPSILSGPKTGA